MADPLVEPVEAVPFVDPLVVVGEVLLFVEPETVVEPEAVVPFALLISEVTVSVTIAY